MKSLSRAQLFATPWTVACTKVLYPWDFLGKSTGVGCRFPSPGTLPTQGLNPGLPHCTQTLYRLSPQCIVKGFSPCDIHTKCLNKGNKAYFDSSGNSSFRKVLKIALSVVRHLLNIQ